MVLCIPLIILLNGALLFSNLPGHQLRGAEEGTEGVITPQALLPLPLVPATAVTYWSCGNGDSIDSRWLNDDHCDCNDGSDETATGACSYLTPGVKSFECTGGGRVMQSRVRDGVCDCCDGSDESVPCDGGCGMLRGITGS